MTEKLYYLGRHVIRAVLFFLCAYPLAIILTSAMDKQFAYLQLISVIFAVSGSLAGICFSWARAMKETNSNAVYIQDALRTGEKSLTAAICFLIAAGFKYYLVAQHSIVLHSVFFKRFVTLLYVAFFGIALIIFWYGLQIITLALYRKLFHQMRDNFRDRRKGQNNDAEQTHLENLEQEERKKQKN